MTRDEIREELYRRLGEPTSLSNILSVVSEYLPDVMIGVWPLRLPIREVFRYLEHGMGEQGQGQLMPYGVPHPDGGFEVDAIVTNLSPMAMVVYYPQEPGTAPDTGRYSN